MLQKEELSNILKEKEFSHIFEEKITFLPTYKFQQGKHEYNYSEGKRIPSHTDRILLIKNEDIFTVKGYTMDDKTAISDHKPVIFRGEL